MKLIIECDGVKRELSGPFEICASRADLATLRDQLSYVLADDARETFTYGWISIWPKTKRVENSPPLPWTWFPPTEKTSS